MKSSSTSFLKQLTKKYNSLIISKIPSTNHLKKDLFTVLIIFIAVSISLYAQKPSNLLKQQTENVLKIQLTSLQKEISKKEDLEAYRNLENTCIRKKWNCNYEISVFKNFYLPLVRAQKKYDGKIVKTFEKRKVSPEEHQKFITLYHSFFDKHPAIKKQFHKKHLSSYYKTNFSQYIFNQKTTEAKYLVFLELSKELMKMPLQKK